MLRALNSHASVELPDGLVDETRYAFRSDVPTEGAIVTPYRTGMTPEEVLEERLSRLHTALDPDFVVTDRFERDLAFATACGVAFRARVFDVRTDGRLIVVHSDAQTCVLDVTGPESDEVCAAILRTAAPSNWAGPAPPGWSRSFAGWLSFELPSRFREPDAFAFGLDASHFAIELGAPEATPPEALIYSDPDHPAVVVRLSPLDIDDRERLERWRVDVRTLGEPRTIRVLRGRAGAAVVSAWGPDAQEEILESSTIDIVRTLVVSEHG